MTTEASFDWFDSRGRIFEPTVSHTYIEISNIAGGIDDVTKQMRDDEVTSICMQSNARKEGTVWRLRLLVSEYPIQTFQNHRLPYSPETFETLRNYWHMNGESRAYSRTPGARNYEIRDTALVRKNFVFATSTVVKGLLVVSYDCDIGDTCASLCCRDQFRDDIIPRLLAMKSSANLPHLLAFIFTARYLEAVEKLFYSRPVHGMMVVQDELGVGSYLRVDSAEAKTLDLRDMPGTLVSLDHFVTTLRLSESTAVKLINSLTSLIDDFDTLDPGGINMKLCVRTSVLQLEVDELGAQIRAMKEGVQSMVQMVYASLQQRDNDLNHRYAADMRVITTITLVFLPGTFVATLFSASFWNFDPRSTGPLVSGWVWLYFFVTFALTIIVLGVWRGYTFIKHFVKTVKSISRTKHIMRCLGRKKDLEDEEAGKKAE